MKPPIDAVHVWLGDDVVDEAEWNAYQAVLDDAERARAARFRFDEHRRRFVVAHGLLRVILGVYGLGDPASQTLDRRCAVCLGRDHGKPYLVLPTGEPAELRFSISYSGRLIAMAFSVGRETGIDVEKVDPAVKWQEVANHVFSEPERKSLEALEGDAARRAFYEIWTRKEALSKVSGLGLSQAVDIDTTAWVYGEDGTFEVAGTSSGRDLDLNGSHCGAVAVQGRVEAFTRFASSHRESLEMLGAAGSFAPQAVREPVGRRIG